ncbi:MAG TPA: PUA domain-containing protein [Xanthomonadales bacterium]|nr:PUA domain-containing protein [Xanthomonadales bacterium]
MPDPTSKGTLFIDAGAAKLLRRPGAALVLQGLLYTAGDFRAGDFVYVIVRGVDGGQRAIAKGYVRCDARALDDARRRGDAGPDPALDPVIAPDALKLLWT